MHYLFEKKFQGDGSPVDEKLILKSKAENTRGTREMMIFVEVKRKMPDEISVG